MFTEQTSGGAREGGTLPVAGQHGGARSLRLGGGRTGGVAGEAALRRHPGQEGLVLAHHAGDAYGVV